MQRLMIQPIGIILMIVSGGINRWPRETGSFSTRHRLISWLIGGNAESLDINSRVTNQWLLKGLSQLMGNYHVQFLGGEGP